MMQTEGNPLNQTSGHPQTATAHPKSLLAVSRDCSAGCEYRLLKSGISQAMQQVLRRGAGEVSSPPVIQARCEGTPGIFVLADTCRHVLNVTDLRAISAVLESRSQADLPSSL